MTHYDFIEIGTADFDTICQSSPDSQIGLVVEPVETYINRLPNKPTVKKICGALVTSAQLFENTTIDVFYVNWDIIVKHNLGAWMRGCNSVGKPHDFHLGYFSDPEQWHRDPRRSELPSRNLLDEGLVTQNTVRCISWGMLMDENNIDTVDLLKTDTEGMDCDLLIDIMAEYTKRGLLSKLPNKIVFEATAHTNYSRLVVVKKVLADLGYRVQQGHPDYGTDMYAELQR